MPSSILLLLMVFALASPMFSQEVGADRPNHTFGSLQGIVSVLNPQGQRVALQGVRIVFRRTMGEAPVVSTLTDEAGHYQINQLPPGIWILRAGLEGFDALSKTLELAQGQSLVLNLDLHLAEIHQEIEVQDKASEMTTEGSDPAATISESKLMELPLAEQKYKDALPLAPGVIRSWDGTLNFKGSPEAQGMLLVDSAQTVDPVTGSFSIPIPVDAIQTMNVLKTPFDSEYGGFSGGLATINLKPPSGEWDYGFMDFVPGLRGRSGHIVGISGFTPRFFFGGPILKNKLNFSESTTYEVKKRPVRGLAWPNNETKRQGFNSLTSFQVILSSRHLLTVDLNAFTERQQFANINSLVPQTASEDWAHKGFSVGGNDDFQFGSGALMSTLFRYTRFDGTAHGQGPMDMQLTPEGWGGNFFNAWAKVANEYEGFWLLKFPIKDWHGRHQFKIGVDLTHRSYTGSSVSHPIQLLREDGSPAERIDFSGNGSLRGNDSEVDEFVQDHWMWGDHFALDLGARLLSQSLGRGMAFSPRVGFAYSPDGSQKTVLRGGAGVFYDSVPLLAADFPSNPVREITYFDEAGSPLGPPTILANTYAQELASGAIVPGRSDLSTSPRNSTWNFEIDRQLWPGALLRLSYLSSETRDLFVVTPLMGQPISNSALGLVPNGVSHYRELEATLHLHVSEEDELNISYVRSHARGDLNVLSDIYVPFEQPVIRPDVQSTLNSDIPNRVVSWGVFRLPWKLTVSPVLDVHSGFPYSNVDALQDYVGKANGSRFPTFLSLDMKVYRIVSLRLPFLGGSKRHKFRLGVYSINLTNHTNPQDIYSNIDSPYFGQFAGFQHRVNGLVIDVVN